MERYSVEAAGQSNDILTGIKRCLFTKELAFKATS